MPRILKTTREASAMHLCQFTYGWGNEDKNFEKVDLLDFHMGYSHYAEFLIAQYDAFMVNKIVYIYDHFGYDAYVSNESKTSQEQRTRQVLSVPVFKEQQAQWFGEKCFWRFGFFSNGWNWANPGVKTDIPLDITTSQNIKDYPVNKLNYIKYVHYPKCKKYIDLNAENYKGKMSTLLTSMDCGNFKNKLIALHGPVYGSYFPKKDNNDAFMDLMLSFRVKMYVYLTCIGQHYELKD